MSDWFLPDDESYLWYPPGVSPLWAQLEQADTIDGLIADIRSIPGPSVITNARVATVLFFAGCWLALALQVFAQ